MNKELIEQVVEERTKNWDGFSEEKKQLIIAFAEEVLDFAKAKGIEFDNDAGITFVSHLATMYERLFMINETIEVDDSMLEQVGPELMELSDEVDAQQHIAKHCRQQHHGRTEDEVHHVHDTGARKPVLRVPFYIAQREDDGQCVCTCYPGNPAKEGFPGEVHCPDKEHCGTGSAGDKCRQ